MLTAQMGSMYLLQLAPDIFAVPRVYAGAWIW